MDNQHRSETSLDKTEDWILKYRAALVQEMKRSQASGKGYRATIEHLLRKFLHHFNVTAAPASLRSIPAKVPKVEIR